MNRDAEETHLGMTAGEVGLLVSIGCLLVLSLFGDGSFITDISRPVRVLTLGFTTVELLVPLWVYVDIGRRTDNPDRVRGHLPAMPVINRFALAAYFPDRSRD